MTNVMIYDAHVRIEHDPTGIDNFYQQTLEFLESKYHNYPSSLGKGSRGKIHHHPGGIECDGYKYNSAGVVTGNQVV